MSIKPELAALAAWDDVWSNTDCLTDADTERTRQEAMRKAMAAYESTNVSEQPDGLPEAVHMLKAAIQTLYIKCPASTVDYILKQYELAVAALSPKRESGDAPLIVLSPKESDQAVLHFFRAGFNIVINRPLPTEIEGGK